MLEAIKEAKKAYKKNEVPVGAIIVINDLIISRAHNLTESTKSSLAHAEMLAIKRACQTLGYSILNEATIYSTLEPCLMCTGAIYQSRIKRVVYGTFEPKFGTLGSIIDVSKIEGFNHQVEVVRGIHANEISVLMKSFFQKLRLR